MPVRDHHRKPYDEGTQAKLDLYRGYLREWLPVFLQQQHLAVVNVFDFFAGPGGDMDGQPGSPLLAHEEIVSALDRCPSQNPRPVTLYLNERVPAKYAQLTDWIRSVPRDPRVMIVHARKDFDEAFAGWLPLMRRPNAANLLFLDQNGVKQVQPDRFLEIVGLVRTDFLFFISSSMVNRFRCEPSIIDRVPVCPEDLGRMNCTNVHRIVTDAYRKLLPADKRYFVAPFSIKKGANVYGLVFGSGHPLGMEKFLSKCWALDEQRGEANFDIDGEGIDRTAPTLFPEEMDRPKKTKLFAQELEDAVLCRRVGTNKAAFIFALERGFLGRHAKEVLASLMRKGVLPKQKLNVSYDAWSKGEEQTIAVGEGRGT